MIYRYFHKEILEVFPFLKVHDDKSFLKVKDTHDSYAY